MGIVDFIFIALLLLIPVLLSAATFREWMQNTRLANIWVLLMYGIVIIWWILSFIIFYPDPHQTTTCGAGLIICIIARVIHQRVNKSDTDLEHNQGNEERGQTKHMITVGCAILFILGLLCVALIIISKFLPAQH
jgi:hypothetical protein